MSKLYIGINSPKKIAPYEQSGKINHTETFKADDTESAKKIAEAKNFTSFAEVKQVWLQGIDYGK